MGTLFTILFSGFIVSFTCMGYLVFQTWRISEKITPIGEPYSRQKERRINWLSILLLSTGVFYGWCLIGFGVHYLSNDDALVARMPLFALAAALLIYLAKTIQTIRKMDMLSGWIVLNSSLFILTVGALTSLVFLIETVEG